MELVARNRNKAEHDKQWWQLHIILHHWTIPEKLNLHANNPNKKLTNPEQRLAVPRIHKLSPLLHEA